MQYTRKQVGSKQMFIHTYTNGAQIVRSYVTPVAAYIPALGFFKTDEKFSATTTRHIGVWAKMQGYPLITAVPQADIEEWEDTLGNMRMEG
jgi:hypothetical protein